MANNLLETKNVEMGIKFIYLFRQFITQEEMIFSYTSTYYDKSTGQHEYGSYEVPLNDVLNNLLIDANKKEIEFQKNVNSYRSKRKKDLNFSNFYKHLLHMGINLGDDNTYEWRESRDIAIPKHSVGYFHKQNDTNAMYVYSPDDKTKRPQRVYYYEEKKQYLYNQGWLYEWAKRLYEGENNQLNNMIQVFINQVMIEQPNYLLGILFTLSGGRDSEWGSIQGDYARIVNGRRQQIQAKNANKTIISQNQVWQVLEQIKIKILEPFKQYIKTTAPEELGNNTDLQDKVKNLYKSYNSKINKSIQALFEPLEKFAK